MTRKTQIKDLIDEAIMEKLECFLIPKSIKIESPDDWSDLDEKIRILGYNCEDLIYVDECDFYRTASFMKWSNVWTYDLLLTKNIDDYDCSKILLHRWDLEKVEYIKIEQIKV
jgi:hypothetical protein